MHQSVGPCYEVLLHLVPHIIVFAKLPRLLFVDRSPTVLPPASGALQINLKADERDLYEFFSQAGKVRDVRLIMDRNGRRSKGVG